MPAIPSAEVLERIAAGFASVFSRADIYESDTTTPWMLDAPLIDGSVSVDSNRDERRTASMSFANLRGALTSRPGGFWYDKVIKVYRGVTGHTAYILDGNGDPILDGNGDPIEDSSGSISDWEVQVGEFYIDDIDSAHLPHSVNVTARDGTKKLLKAKFAASTEFASGVSIESVVQAIAFAGGIPVAKMDLPLTGVNTDRKHLYDSGTERWKAISEIATVYGYAVYFTHDGMLTLTEFSDPANPALSPSRFTFEVGGRDIRNGSFEELDPITGLPDWWTTTFHQTGSPIATVETGGQQRSEDAALEIYTPSSFDGLGVASKAIPVEAGDVYEIAMWSKATTTGNGKFLRAAFASTEDSLSLANAVDVVANGNFTTDYTETKGEVTVPAGMSWMRVVVYNWAGSAKTAWFDDVSSRRLVPAEDLKGNTVSYGKKTMSSRIYNVVVVSGESSTTIPVRAIATNTEPTSPTRLSELGDQTYFYTSAFVTTVPQAQAIADRFLAVMALESFEVSIESIVNAWLEPGWIVTFKDPVAAPTDPERYLLSDITIPLRPAPMQANVKRVTIVG